MQSIYSLEIVTPEKSFFQGNVEMIIVKTPQGEMGVLDNHVPMVASIATGPIKIKQDGKWIEAVLSEGFMEIEKDKVLVIVDTAEWPDEIDVNRALEAKKRAEERLQRQLSEIEFIRSRASLARAMERLRITKKL